MKKIIVLLFLFEFVAVDKEAVAQPISPMLNSQNFWLPSRGGYGGSLETYWNEIAASGTKYMRIGGIDYNNTMWSNADLKLIIDEMRGYGIEPIIQVPINKNSPISTNASNAANIVTAINVTAPTKSIVHWEIGNEPNEKYGGTIYNYDKDTAIAHYIKDVSTAMKGVAGQSNFIKIIGPSFSYYSTSSYNKFLGGSCDITGTNTNGDYYIDYIDFHTYPFQNENYWKTGTADSSGSTPITRNDVIANINAAGKLKDDLAEMITRIEDSTSRTTSNLSITITEANISYQQDRDNKSVTDLGPGSFLGGQFWAEMMGVAMEKGVALLSFWSVIEGTNSGSSNYISDIGYIGKENGPKYRSSYWHYKMMADNFKGTFKPNLYVGNDTTYKAFGYKNTAANEVGVVVMNQKIQNPRGTDTSTDTLRINFNNTAPTAASNMKFRFNDTVSAVQEYTCTITNETTMLLVFDITTGALKKRQTYSLQDALRTTDTGTMTNIANSTEYDAYSSTPVKSDITIGTTPATTITAGANQIFKATNSIRLNGPFSSNGQTLRLEIDHTCP